MSIGFAINLIRGGTLQALMMAAPLLLVGMLVGLIISVFQATTSIQEQTLTFVPKISAMGAVLWESMDYMGHMVISLFQDSIIPMIAGV